MIDASTLLNAVGGLPDPEIPVLTLADLGIVRGVEVRDGGAVVRLSPTYTGCPALDPIRTAVERCVRKYGFAQVDVRLELSPAWTTDWITEEGRAKLAAYGIAPPERRANCALAAAAVRCPRCGSSDTREISRFGATPCQAQHACNQCLEPFDRFKAI